MTFYCFHLLNKINRALSKSKDVTFNYSCEDGKVFDVHKINGSLFKIKRPYELRSAFDELCKNGYLEKSKFGYQLTQKGLHPYQVNISRLIRLLITSVVLPVILSIATTLITLWIQSLLSMK